MATPETTGTAARVAALEAAVHSLAQEVRTRRLVVRDDAGDDRIVAEVRGATAELRVMTAAAAGAVVVFATEPSDLDGGVGVQLWARGDAPVELALWCDGGTWRPVLRVATDG